MNVLTRILMQAVKTVNAENNVKLRKMMEFGDEHRGAGVYYDPSTPEYRVLFVGDSAHLTNADYHTDERDDAVDTARTCAAPNPEPEAQPAVQEEAAPLPTRRRPRGFHAQPSKLLQGLLARA
jgi:hypothetical protein